MLKRSPSRLGLRIMVSALVLAAVLTVVVRHDGGNADPRPAVQPTVTQGRPNYSVSGTGDPWAESTPQVPGVAPDDSALVGDFTNHLEFARRVATLLLAYDAGTDFAARNADLLRAAAPTPYGDPTGLAETLAAYTPTGEGLESIKATHTRVAVLLSGVAVSDWAAHRLAARGASSGVYGIDITATQTISTRTAPRAEVPVRMGLTVACPPAVEFCTLAGVFPQFLQDALGSG